MSLITDNGTTVIIDKTQLEDSSSPDQAFLSFIKALLPTELARVSTEPQQQVNQTLITSYQVDYELFALDYSFNLNKVVS